MSGTKERVTRGHGDKEGGETMRGLTFPPGSTRRKRLSYALTVSVSLSERSRNIGWIEPKVSFFFTSRSIKAIVRQSRANREGLSLSSENSPLFSITEEGPHGFQHLAVPGAGWTSRVTERPQQPSIPDESPFGGMGKN